MNAQLAFGAPRLLSPVRATAIFVAVSATVVGSLHAQTLPAQSARLNDGVVANAPAAETDEVALLVGRSTLLTVGQPITRVSLTSPNVADAMVTSPGQLLIHGKAPGTISMFVWDRAGGIKRYEVVVRRDLSELLQQVKQLFPGEPITVHSNGKDVVISGTVSSKYVIDKAAEVAAGYVEKKEDVVNLLRQQEGIASNQVLLRVRFAEVSRSALTELGVNLFATGADNGRWFGRTSTQQFSAPVFDDGRLVFSDFLNLFLFDAKNNLGGVVRALQNKGLFQSLAEPNLIAENGKEASFLAGGEYPYPVVQGQSGGTSVTIQFKEFGVRLTFTPTIVGGDLIKLKVAPEVSSLDFSNAVTLEGFRVPAISTRRTNTEVELQDGQTFAIAGLMNNTVTSQMSKIPGIGDIPILGYLFRSKAAQKNQTELVVMITPTILKRGSTGVGNRLPETVEPYMPAPDKTMPQPAPWNPNVSAPQAQAPQAQPQAQPAAPRVSAPAVVRTEEFVPEPTPAPAPVKKQTKAEREAAEKAAKAQAKADEEARKQAARQAEIDRKQAAEAAKIAAESARVEARKAEEQRKVAEKAAKEQARVQAEIDRRIAEAAKRQAVIDQKEAEQRAVTQAKLDAARREYEAAIAKIQTTDGQPR